MALAAWTALFVPIVFLLLAALLHLWQVTPIVIVRGTQNLFQYNLIDFCFPWNFLFEHIFPSSAFAFFPDKAPAAVNLN